MLNQAQNPAKIAVSPDAGKKIKPVITREILDSLYNLHNHRTFVSPDPLQFLYDYPDPSDREVVGIIASALAYGRVSGILKSVSTVLGKLGKPTEKICSSTQSHLRVILKGFKHRFTTGEELACMLHGVGKVIKRFGSIENCFMSGMSPDDENIIPGLTALVHEISIESGRKFPHLLPDPTKGSACKRMNLYLRWMVREDDVDPGGWEKVSRSQLLVPLDIHMFRICTMLGLTCRKQANLRTVMEITNAFREINPDDPVRYDFAITRLGIRDELNPGTFINRCTGR